MILYKKISELGEVMIRIDTIATERLVLKKLKIDDLDDYFEWRSQEEYHNFLPSKPKSKEEYKKTIESIVTGYENEEHPTLMWGMFLNDKLIGSVSIEDWSLTHKYCEIGWGLNPKFQKKGFALEAVSEVIKFIFNVLDMNRIAAYVWEGNEQSCTLAKKLGFVHEGTDRKARFKNNKFLDVYCFGLLKEEWEKG